MGRNLSMKPEIFRFPRGLFWGYVFITLVLFAPIVMALLGVRDDKGQVVPIVVIIICSLVGTGAGIAATWLGRKYILVNEDGLFWCDLGPEQSMRWDEIADYFISLNQQGHRIYTIKSVHGRQLNTDAMLRDHRRLLELIALHATSAKASSWLIQSTAGTVSGKQLFSYSQKSYLSFLWQQITPVAVLLTGTLLLFLFFDIRTTWFAQLFFALMSYGASVCTWRAIREARLHLGTRIEVDEHTLTFVRSNGDEKTIRWSDIASVHVRMVGLSQRHELRTTEDQFHIFESLEHGIRFRQLLHHYCPLIITRNTPSGDALIPTEKQDGKRVFHYQTRSNRRLLGALLGCALLPLWATVYVWNTYRQAPDTDMPSVSLATPLTLVGLLFFGWVWAFWRYKSTRLILDTEGITQIALRGKPRITYNEITWLGADEWFFVGTEKEKRPIRWNASISDADQLRQELEMRTGLAFNKDRVTPSPKLVEKVQNPAEEPNDVQQKLKGGYTGR